MGEKTITSQDIPDEMVRSDDHRVAELIAQLQQRTGELEQANSELRRVSHYRSLFLARMSHELRTPLTSILGFSEILLDQEPLTETQRRFCQKIQDSGVQLQTSLNQLVAISRLEAGQTEVFLQEFSLREMLRESCSSVARLAHKQQVTIEYDINSEITTVVSDQTKLRQVLYNFLSWALSRSKAGQVVKTRADFSKDGGLLLVIEDSGPHIADLAHVFDPQATSSREPDLNELGIIISHRLLEIMSGDVVLENREPRGVKASIRVPAGPPKG